MDKSSSKLNKRLIIAIVILLIAAPAFYIGLGCIDETRREFPQLAYTVTPLNLSEINGLNHLYKAADLVDNSDKWRDKMGCEDENQIYHPNHQYDVPFWERIFKLNKRSLELLDQGTLGNYYFFDNDTSEKSTSKIISLIELFSLRSAYINYLIETAQWQAAIEAIEKNQAIASESKTLIQLLVAVAIEANTHRNVNSAIESSTIPDTALTKLIKLSRVTPHPEYKSAFSTSLKLEFIYIKEHLDIEALSYMSDGADVQILKFEHFALHKKKFTNDTGDLYTEFLKYESLHPPEIHKDLQALVKKYDQRPSTTLDHLKPNYVGRENSTNFQIIGRQALRLYRSKITGDLLAYKAAAVLYQRQNKRQLDKLVDLGSFIGEKLYDPMAAPNTPYQFSATTRRVWSIGENMTDEGGKE